MGINIGEKNYQDADYQKDLARLDVVILGFYRGWQPDGYAPTSTLAIRKVLKAIKARNPKILIGQYTILGEAYDDPKNTADQDKRDKLYASQWWLLNSAGRKVQWTSEFRAWEVNLTTWPQADGKGRHWPEWLAERDYAVFFRDIPEFDIVFLDNVGAPRVTADWNLDGKNDDRDEILAAHYAGHLAEWNRLRELAPGRLLIGNTDNDLANAQWRGQLDGGILEAQMGLSWSLETRAGWGKMMERYRAVLHNTRPPRIVGFNVHGSPTDYRFFRYAYASCLLDDGYFSFTDKAREYSGVTWFDEYDHKLGNARSGPPTAAWSQEVWRRDFQNGVVLVNPTTSAKTVKLEPGLRRLAGHQDPAINNGSAASQVTLEPKDGIVLLRQPALQESPR
ncbi:MAG TPA: putative glycoside hydrolase [Burkholderiales bacterium]|nr:putative glycoside hydrolase [Burkholderiales bacterium]